MQHEFELETDLLTPIGVYRALRPLRPRFLLESARPGPLADRYALIGLGPAEEIRWDADGLTVDGRRVPEPASRAELLDFLRARLSEAPRFEHDIDALAFRGGLVGAAGYGLARRLDRVRGSALDQAPVLAFDAPRACLVIDSRSRAATLLYDGPASRRQELQREISKLLSAPTTPTASPRPVGAARPELDREAFRTRVLRAKEAIAAGDVYQLVLSTRFEGTGAPDPVELYRNLRRSNPSPYHFLFELGARTLVGASPEALVRSTGSHAFLQPIAGTRRRGHDRSEDLLLERELLADPKEAAEHVMLVDLARNDLGRVAQARSVAVDPYRTIERFSHVMHIVSGVKGVLESGIDGFELFAAVFPAGTVVGAPKLAAMEEIVRLEDGERDFYAGSVGYFGHDGVVDQAITIRTLVVERERHSFQAGAGIVADSDPDAEYDEVLAKAGALQRAIRPRSTSRPEGRAPSAPPPRSHRSLEVAP